MLLAADIGNTQVTFGVFEQRRLSHTFRAGSDRERTQDEWFALVHQLLSVRSLGPGQVTGAIVASVVPSLTTAVGGALLQLAGRQPLVVGTPGCKTDLAVLYDAPSDVGADRIVNSVAAWERYRAGALIIDFGTATTIDCVSPAQEYLGGVIIPGIRLGLEALLGRSEKLPSVPLVAPSQVLGNSTRRSLQSGVVHGYAALVDGLVEKLRSELAFDCRVLATGGLASVVAPHTKSVSEVDPDLTLHGLRILYDQNRPPSPAGP